MHETYTYCTKEITNTCHFGLLGSVRIVLVEVQVSTQSLSHSTWT